MLTEAELKALLDTPEADRTPEQKKALVELFTPSANSGRKSEDKGDGKREVPATWLEVFDHPRFKELTQAAADAKARADALEKAAQDAETKQLEEAQNFKKLYEKAQSDLSSLKPKAEQLDQMEQTLKTLLEAEVKSLPDQFQDVVPDGLSTQAKLEWLGRNKAKFLKPEAFDIGAGKNGAKKPDPKDQELTIEEKVAAQSIGMTPEEYMKYKDPNPATS